MIKAKIVADSVDPRGNRLVSVLATFPRIILAEINTHRMLSKNTSSSRAIPFFKSIESVINNPFIPIAWQTHHKGMQGSEYISMDTIITAPKFLDDFIKLLENQAREDKVNLSPQFYSTIYKCRGIFETLFYRFGPNGEELHQDYTITEFWLKIRDIIVFASSTMYTMGKISKQICNRLLEPFMWTTMLITGPIEGGWNNFFNLRCPSYISPSTNKVFKSKRDYSNDITNNLGHDAIHTMKNTDWLYINKGMAEVHMMQLAECIWDAVNESNPRRLLPGDYHIPFNNDIIKILADKNSDNHSSGLDWILDKVKVSVAMAARTSYTIVGEEKTINWKSLIELHDRLINQNPPHSSPMEHCAKVMTQDEYDENIKGKIDIDNQDDILIYMVPDNTKGWCRNFRGFIPYRHIIETNNN